MTTDRDQERPAPVVSVIVPAHNYGHFIALTLDSVASQTYPHWECLIIDDGSVDNTKEVVMKYADQDPRFKYVYQENAGLAAARNAGIRRAAGSYVQFLDADDLIAPRKLEEHARILARDSGVDIVYGGVRYFTTEDPAARLYSRWGENKPWMPEISGAGESVLRALVRRNIMVVNAPLIRKSVFEAVGLFDKTSWGVEDYDYWIRCGAHGIRFQYASSEESLALVRTHASSMSGDRRGMLRGELNARRKAAAAARAKDILDVNRQKMVECSAWLAFEEVKFNDYFRGAYRLLKAGAARPGWWPLWSRRSCQIIVSKRSFTRLRCGRTRPQFSITSGGG